MQSLSMAVSGAQARSINSPSFLLSSLVHLTVTVHLRKAWSAKIIAFSLLPFFLPLQVYGRQSVSDVNPDKSDEKDQLNEGWRNGMRDGEAPNCKVRVRACHISPCMIYMNGSRARQKERRERR